MIKNTKKNQSAALNICISAISTAIGTTSTAASIGSAVLGYLISDALEVVKNSKSRAAIQDKLVKLCGVKHIADAKTLKGSWTAKKGLCVSEYFTGQPTALINNIYYDAVNDTDIIRGEKWYVGSWKF